jgi:hypothetical protein
LLFNQSSIIASETRAIVSFANRSNGKPMCFQTMSTWLSVPEYSFACSSCLGSLHFVIGRTLSFFLFLFYLPADTDLLEKSTKMDGAETSPHHEFLYEDASNCSPSNGYLACSAVIPSLPLTIKWLRDCVRENPSLRLQVRILS